MDEIKIDTIEWSAPEYSHKERSNDWFWSLGLITIIAAGIAFWFNSNIFAIFILISGGTLIMFTFRHPNDVTYIIETKGLTMGKDLHIWKSIKSFNIKNIDTEPYAKILIETSNYILPIYTIPFPKELESQIKENLLKITPRSEIDESKSMVFMEKLGF
ncbi:MAG: hypothetical protein NTU81_01770 [Candidatus Nomurabacteria bacterium]|nr:hypothetical protein [Candidatus Nomurabacteria bacterium]